jgi:predicted homoserine dehydrogenase-like protein
MTPNPAHATTVPTSFSSKVFLVGCVDPGHVGRVVITQIAQLGTNMRALTMILLVAATIMAMLEAHPALALVELVEAAAQQAAASNPEVVVFSDQNCTFRVAREY